MNEQYFAHRIRQNLNRGMHDLRPETVERLASARKLALEHQKQPAAYPVLALAGNILSFGMGNSSRLQQFFAALALLCLAGYSTYWIADQRVQELGDIDSAILSDELPIGAFTDKGFAAWLNNSSRD